MSYPLRLPAHLDAASRERAAAIGISFNAWICVAVEAYLRGNPPAAVAPRPGPPADAELESLVGQVEAHARTVPEWAIRDPKPILSAQPTKRERRALAQWHERERLQRGEFAIPDVG